MSLEKAHDAELWWVRPPTRWGSGVIYSHSDVQGAPSRGHWTIMEGAPMGSMGRLPACVDAMDEDGWRVNFALHG